MKHFMDMIKEDVYEQVYRQADYQGYLQVKRHVDLQVKRQLVDQVYMPLSGEIYDSIELHYSLTNQQ